MLLALSHLPADGLKFEHQFEADELDLSQHEFTFEKLPFVQGKVTTVGAETRVKGVFTATINAVCDRCAEDVKIPLQQDFDLFYLPAESNKGKTGETELIERELDVSFFSDDRIDLNELVLEQIELSLPTRILCQENCQGLCEQCGTNLNVEKCHCQPEIDPRWQALADLKN